MSSLKAQLSTCQGANEPSQMWITFAELGQTATNKANMSLEDNLNGTAIMIFTNAPLTDQPKEVPGTTENWLTSVSVGCGALIPQETIGCAVISCFSIQINDLAIGIGWIIILPSLSLDGEKLLEAVEKHQFKCTQPVFQHLLPIFDSPSHSHEKMQIVANVPVTLKMSSLRTSPATMRRGRVEPAVRLS